MVVTIQFLIFTCIKSTRNRHDENTGVYTSEEKLLIAYVFPYFKLLSPASDIIYISCASVPSYKSVRRPVIFRNMAPLQRSEAKEQMMKSSYQWMHFDLKANFTRIPKLNPFILVSLMKLLKGTHLRFLLQMSLFLFINFSHFCYWLK